jgi:Ras-related C3 botulinum toxin substrate 1
VATKSDLRIPNSEKFVTTVEAKKLKSKLKASALVECSAIKKENLNEVFEAAVRAIDKKQPNKPCNIL